MNKRQYATLSSQGKDNLIKSRNTLLKSVEPSLTEKQNKFLEHFKSINNVDPFINVYARSTSLSDDHETLYVTKLESYAESKVSQIERIMRSNDDDTHIKTVRNDFKITPAVPLIHSKPQIKRNIQKINDFFSIEPPKLSIDQKKQQEELFQTQILEIATYSEILKNLPDKQKQLPKPQPPNFFSIYNTSTEQPIYEIGGFQSNPIKISTNNLPEVERFSTPDKFGSIQSNPNQRIPEVSNGLQPETKFRKADMLLVEILREKKRKGLVADYYKIMELKLFQLLDFILQDQPEFEGLSSIEKMKQVLKKLEYFKGKKIEGENKINLLKIFFEEFRNVKNEKHQSEKNKPLQKVENKPKVAHQNQLPHKEAKQADKKGQNNLKKTPYKETTSVNGDKKPKRQSSNSSKSVKGMEDEWMGDLQ